MTAKWSIGWPWEEGDWRRMYSPCRMGWAAMQALVWLLRLLGLGFKSQQLELHHLTPPQPSEGTQVDLTNPCCCPPTSPQHASVLLWQASHPGPVSQIPVTTHQTAPAPVDQLKNPVPGVIDVPCVPDPLLCFASEMDTDHVSDKNEVYERSYFIITRGAWTQDEEHFLTSSQVVLQALFLKPFISFSSKRVSVKQQAVEITLPSLQQGIFVQRPCWWVCKLYVSSPAYYNQTCFTKEYRTEPFVFARETPL